MKKKQSQVIALITLLFLSNLISGYGQIFEPSRENPEIFLSEEDNKYLSGLYPKMNIQKSPEVTMDEIINSKIFELANYGKSFKYSNDIFKGYYCIRTNNNKFTIFILRNLPTNINRINLEAADYSIRESNIKAKLDFQLTEIDGNKYTELINGNDFFETNENDFNLISSTSNITNYVFSSKIIIDKEALNFGPNQQYGKIANKSKSEQFLRDDQGNPSSVFCSATDGVILPHFSNEWNGLGMTVDECWNRVVQSDKKYVQKIESFGSFGSGDWQFSSPSGIEYSPFYYLTNNGCFQYKNYPVYIADNGNSRIIKFIYRIGYCPSPNPIWYMAPPQDWQILKNNLLKPYDLASHPGTDLNNLSDDVIWYSENPGLNSLGGSIVALNGVTGNEIQRISQINFGNGLENIYPSRLSIYRSSNGHRNILTFVDINKNFLVFIKLNSNGNIDLNSNYVFSIIGFQGQILNSVLLNSYENGLNENETTVWAVSDGGPGGCEYQDHCGTIHILKVKYILDLPVGVEYLASTWKGINSDKSFQDLNNLHMQNGFVDLFTLEKWDNNYGLRWFKPGIDMISESNTSFCPETGRMNITIRTTNPSRVQFQDAQYNSGGIGSQWVTKPGMTINGLSINSFQYLQSGTSILNIGIPNIPLVGDVPTPKVKVRFAICPQDEIPGSVIKEYEANVETCTNYGGCPYVFVQNGNEFTKDNNILHRSEFNGNVGNDIEDKYLLRINPSFNQTDSTCQLKIKELNNDVSHFDKFRLVAIDHPSETNFGITENNDYVLYFPSITESPEHAEHNGDDVTPELNYDSSFSKTVKGDENDLIVGSFPTFRNSSLKKNMQQTLLNSINGLNYAIKKNNSNSKNKNQQIIHDSNLADSIVVLIDPSQNDAPTIIGNPAKRPAGIINAYDLESEYAVENILFARRQNTSPVLITVGRNVNIDSISAVWNTDFQISYAAITPVYYGGYIENEFDLIEATDSLNGNVLDSLLNVDQIYSVMDSTTNITLKFKNTFGDVPSGFVREYVLITNGRYENISESDNGTLNTQQNQNITIPNEYKLYQNYPNPFNPTTTIKFDLPKEGLVTFKIYDILGKEVYSLREIKQAGYHQINFDGSNFSSGVYFYRIESNDFVQTKRMVLIK